MSSTQTSTEQRNPTAATVDLKLEVVAIPVSDVDRAKAFYGELGWTARRRFHGREGLSSGAADTSRIAMLDPFGTRRRVPGSAQGMFLVVVRHRGGAPRAHRPRGRCE